MEYECPCPCHCPQPFKVLDEQLSSVCYHLNRVINHYFENHAEYWRQRIQSGSHQGNELHNADWIHTFHHLPDSDCHRSWVSGDSNSELSFLETFVPSIVAIILWKCIQESSH